MDVSYNNPEKRAIFFNPKTLGKNKAQTLSLIFFVCIIYLFKILWHAHDLGVLLGIHCGVETKKTNIVYC